MVSKMPLWSKKSPAIKYTNYELTMENFALNRVMENSIMTIGRSFIYHEHLKSMNLP